LLVQNFAVVVVQRSCLKSNIFLLTGKSQLENS
jgi:hypothetical protein